MKETRELRLSADYGGLVPQRVELEIPDEISNEFAIKVCKDLRSLLPDKRIMIQLITTRVESA